MARLRYQFGSLTLKNRKRGPAAWEFRYYEDNAGGGRERKTTTIGTVKKYPSEAAARRAVEGLLLALNAETPQYFLVTPTVGGLIDRYVREELPERYSTRESYLSMLNCHIRPQWSELTLDKVKPLVVEQWLKRLSLAGKTKAHIRSLMHLLFNCAERWELIEMGKNPIELVRVKGCTKRRKKPLVLTSDQCQAILPFLRDPYRTMVIIAQCLGLRVSEIVALQWGDFDFSESVLLVQRGVVHGRVGLVKTEYSNDLMPLAPELRAVMLDWKGRTKFTADTDWVFTNPETRKPYWQESIQQNHIKKAALKAGLGPGVGWHTFRHTYASMLHANGEALKVQQELLRHAAIQTTMNVYTQAVASAKREANAKVVQMVLTPKLMSEVVQNPSECAPSA